MVQARSRAGEAETQPRSAASICRVCCWEAGFWPSRCAEEPPVGVGCLEAPSALPPVSTRPLPARRGLRLPGTTPSPLCPALSSHLRASLGVRKGRLPMQPTHPVRVLGRSLHKWLQLTGQLKATELDSLNSTGQASEIKVLAGPRPPKAQLSCGVPFSVRGQVHTWVAVVQTEGVAGFPCQHSWLPCAWGPQILVCWPLGWPH